MSTAQFKHKPTVVTVKILPEPMERPDPPRDLREARAGDALVMYPDGTMSFMSREKLARLYDPIDEAGERLLADS